MIKLNFIPEQQRKQSVKLVGEDFGGIPGQVIVGCMAAFLGLIILIHIVLAGVIVYKFGASKILEVRWNAMGPDKKAFDEVTNELGQLQQKMNLLKPITAAQSLRWSRFLNDISDSVPKGVWLREINYENNGLAIYGSAVSKMKNEMVEAGNFVTELKKAPSIKDNFNGMDVESIQRRENSAISIADFLLKAKRK